jgi:hypothetical protein
MAIRFTPLTQDIDKETEERQKPKGVRFVPLERPMSRKELSVFAANKGTNQTQRKVITDRMKRAYSTLGYSELGTPVDQKRQKVKADLTDVKKAPAEAVKALVAGTERAIGSAGTLAQWAWEKATLGEIVTRGVDVPGAGWIAEHLIRKYGPKKALALADKKMKQHAETGRKFADFFEEQANKGWEAPDPELMRAKWDRPVQYGTRVTMESAPSFIAAIAAGYGTKNPNVALGLMGAFEKMNSYRKQRQMGASVRKADIISSLSGAWEAATEKIPFDFILKGKTKTRLLKAITGAGLEGIQELVAGMGQNYLEYFGYEAKDWKSIPAAHKEGFQHIMDNWLEAVVAGTVLGGAVSGTIEGFSGRDLERVGKTLGVPVTGLTREAAAEKINEVLEARRGLQRDVDEVAEPPITPPKAGEGEVVGITGIIKNKAVTQGRTGEDLEIKPEFAEKYKSVAMLQGNRVFVPEEGEVNHAQIAERLGFPKDLIPGFIDSKDNFVYQYEEDVPITPAKLLMNTCNSLKMLMRL